MKRMALLALVAAVVLARADQEAEPHPMLFTAGERGSVVFAMLPGADASRKLDGLGIAYRLSCDGKMEELYRTSGWFSFRVFISAEGRYLVRVEDSQRGHDPSSSHVALAFYDSGRLLKSYTTLDLVRDRTKLIHSVSHFAWIAYPEGAKRSAREPRLLSDSFVLTTVDGLTYEFDLSSGTVASLKEEGGEPGATDNPDDAQRVREDH